MKLTNKFTLWYFAVMLVVLLIGGAIVYYEIQGKISRVEVVRHQRLNDIIAQQIRAGGDYTNHPTRKRVTVTLYQPTRCRKASLPIIPGVPAGTRNFRPMNTGWSSLLFIRSAVSLTG